MKKIDVNDTITIFGGNGFIGSYIVKELAKTGAKIKIISRYPEENNQLKVCGAVGQITFIRGDVTSFEDIERNIQGSDYVINLVGILFEHGNQKFKSLHVEAAKNIALSCSNNHVKRLIHFSALGIDKNRSSKYAVTKLKGEKEVLKVFPSTIVIRPSVVFGVEDNFINMFMRLARFSPILPLIGGGNVKFQPVYVADVAKAVKECMIREGVVGKVFELGGPKTYTLKEVYQLILKLINKQRMLINLPFSIAKIQAFFLEFLPNPLLTRDQIELLKTDNILLGKNGLEELGISPASMEAILPGFIK